MNPPPSKQDRQGPGRRESDRIYESIVRELDNLANRLREVVQELRGLIHKEVEDLEEAIKKVDTRLTEVETERLEELAIARGKMVDRQERNERWTKRSIIIGIVVGCIAVADGITRLIHIILH